MKTIVFPMVNQQKETQIIADKIDQQSAKMFPFSWKALRVDRE